MKSELAHTDKRRRMRLAVVIATVLLGAGGLVLLVLSVVCSGRQRQGVEAVAVESVQQEHTNRLGLETSPYLLQHAHNPVDWYPWGPEAFERAKAEDKPIFLSIGYSTCHWCHVMERESFTDEHIAAIMNEHFVSIKVDREQRPDVDRVYMAAVQMMTGGGGWPMSVFLTPDGKPFYGGTYFPPRDSFGRAGFERVLLAIADAWRNRRTELLESAGTIGEMLAKQAALQGRGVLSVDILKDAKSQLERAFDDTHGGFGAAPKFPQPSTLSMLLTYWHRIGDEKALEMVETTLAAMAKGGINDHLGGGFHRYATDSEWLVPHFEKMLYDQALLSKVYVQAYQATGKAEYAAVAKDIFDYVLDQMTDPAGGFYSAEDADSQGKEGTFYVWEPKQTQKILGSDIANVFNEYYGVTEGGNFEDGKTVLSVTKSVEELAGQFKRDPKDIDRILSDARAKLLEYRSKRPRPHLDDKIICGWNGLMISSLAYGGAVLGEHKYVDAAERAAQFALSELRSDGRLMRYYRKTRSVGLAFLDDYAFMTMGLLDLYEATFDARWLLEATELADGMIELFADQDGGGFYLTGEDAERLIVRTRPDYDGAVPSGNSVAALALLRLGRMTMEQRFTQPAEQLLEAFSGRMAQSPTSLTACLVALDFQIGPTQEIVLAGDLERKDMQEMLSLIRSKFLPNAVVLFHGKGQAGEAIEKVVPFVRGHGRVNNAATAYVCENYVCRRPVNGPGPLSDLLAGVTETKSGY